MGVAALACGIAACATSAPLRASVAPATVVIGAPDTPAAPEPPAAPAASAAPVAVVEPPSAAPPEPPPALPKAWLELARPVQVPHADAMRTARKAAADVVALTPPRGKDEEAAKAWFSKTQLLAERADRAFATAFAAVDAPASGRVDAVSEATALASTVAARLEAAGLGVLPRTWRVDERVHATFEDVEVGPVRRIRAAARALAAKCTQTGAELGVQTPAVARCARYASSGSTSPTGCACDPGDPLCTGTSWCGP